MENRQMEENQPKEQCSRMDQIDLGDFHEWLVKFPHETVHDAAYNLFCEHKRPSSMAGKIRRFLQ